MLLAHLNPTVLVVVCVNLTVKYFPCFSLLQLFLLNGIHSNPAPILVEQHRRSIGRFKPISIWGLSDFDEHVLTLSAVNNGWEQNDRSEPGSVIKNILWNPFVGLVGPMTILKTVFNVIFHRFPESFNLGSWVNNRRLSVQSFYKRNSWSVANQNHFEENDHG